MYYANHRKMKQGQLSEEIIDKNFPNVRKDIDLQFHVAKQTPSRINTERLTPRHIIIKLLKDKENHESITYNSSSIK